MPGNNPAEAVSAYIDPLQQSLSCFTKAILRPSGYDPGILLNLTTSEPTIDLITRQNEVLHLSFVQSFSIEKSVFGRSYKIKTRSYIYMLEDEGHRDIIGFHWHPESNLGVPFPHLHIYEGAGGAIRQDIRKIHFRTDRFAFEEFGLMLLDEFEVQPDRENARTILGENCAKFRRHRSWASH